MKKPMNVFVRKSSYVLLLTLVMPLVYASYAQEKTIIIVFDGLRPEFINPNHMPHLYGLQQEGSFASNSHSVFPTVTRVNSTSYATGSYPYRHGILGNAIHIPEVASKRVFDTGKKEDLLEIESHLSTELVTAPTAGEILQETGKTFYAFGSGSTGQAYLQNPSSSGVVIHPAYIKPAQLEKEIRSRIGFPDTITHKTFAQHRWLTDAFLAVGLEADGPAVSSVWYAEPDAAQHMHGVGSPEALEAIKVMDEQLGLIREAMIQRGLKDRVNIIVTADHGFITYGGDHTLARHLIDAGLKQSASSDDVVIAEGALFIKEGGPGKLQQIVQSLQQQDWAGPIFTKGNGDGYRGSVAGTLAFSAIHWDHPQRAADILVTYQWDSLANVYGYPGIGRNKSPIAAGHGGISPFEIHTAMVLHGPAFKSGFSSDLPTSFIDIMPTVLALQGIDDTRGMDGRVMTEFLEGNTLQPRVHVEKITERLSGPNSPYEVEIQVSTVDGQRYIDYGRVNR